MFNPQPDCDLCLTLVSKVLGGWPIFAGFAKVGQPPVGYLINRSARQLCLT